MMSPAGYAIAAITVMLWIMWSDTLRARRPSPILYTIRIALFLVVSGLLVHNLVRYPHIFAGAGKAFAILAVVVGILGAAYFARRLVRRV
ncbi:MAG: hypothetical protein JJE51_06470 [Thermoanaerobaculia bacterium]|nr:hypothetical protein [Thermoanaerobaculia bacterium]